MELNLFYKRIKSGQKINNDLHTFFEDKLQLGEEQTNLINLIRH